MKSVQGDSGHSQIKMVADVYSHILDEDRRLNAQRFEDAFYSKNNKNEENPQDDKTQLLKLLDNPEMAKLLKALAQSI